MELYRLTPLLALLPCGCMDAWFIPIPDNKDTGPTEPWADLETGGLLPPPEPDEETCEGAQAPAAYTASLDETCQAPDTHPMGTFNPTVEWVWRKNQTLAPFQHVMTTPVVINLNDDDGDGIIGDADTPEILFVAFREDIYGNPGALTVLDGATGDEEWSIKEAGGYHFYPVGMVAAGDLDGDGVPEICTPGTDTSLVCLTAAGQLLWAAGDHPYTAGAPAIADLDGDGRGEVVFGPEVFDAEGHLIGESPYGSLFTAWYAVPADVNLDGRLEIVTGNHIFNADGSVLWYNGKTDAFPAVANFDTDDTPEIVRTGAEGKVELLDTNGDTLWSREFPGGCGGPAVVADLDGDGEPEIGAGGMNQYVVFDTDGTILWSMPTQDSSSCLTGSSAFDFEGDGESEIVYADEQTVWVFAGRDGSVKLEYESHSNGTLYEYPVIADVDADGSTEIVFGSNDYYYEGMEGITVLGSSDSSWAPARPIWNQHAYHVTNIENDGSIPTNPEESWLVGNTFRAAHTVEGPPQGGWVELAPGRLETCLLSCGEDEVTLWLAVENRGSATAATFHTYLDPVDEGQPTLDTRVSGLRGQEARWLGPFTWTRDAWGNGFNVLVDAEDHALECDESDNSMILGPWPCG